LRVKCRFACYFINRFTDYFAYFAYFWHALLSGAIRVYIDPCTQ